MKIAVTSDSPGREGTVPALFATSPYLLIFETDTNELVHSEERRHSTDVDFARLVLRWDCEGLLCGPIEKEAFHIIADEGCVTRYNGVGLSVNEALERMERRELELIRDCIGGKGCESHSHSGECHEHD